MRYFNLGMEKKLKHSIIGVDEFAEDVIRTRKEELSLQCDNNMSKQRSDPLQKNGLSGRVFLGRVFKNAAQNGIKPRFSKTGLKGARPNCVLHAGP